MEIRIIIKDDIYNNDFIANQDKLLDIELDRDAIKKLLGAVILDSLDDVNAELIDDKNWFAATIDFSINDQNFALSAYYYQSVEDLLKAEELDHLNWDIDHYKIRGIL
jgi:hypothetical protein